MSKYDDAYLHPKHLFRDWLISLRSGGVTDVNPSRMAKSVSSMSNAARRTLRNAINDGPAAVQALAKSDSRFMYH